ncbi:MAG: NYN domain-containing protein, partial [Candidatus Omnitrophica bacterium]|nr:NYN domain-containing protein [Candidatus Omnitrophota bacterium]
MSLRFIIDGYNITNHPDFCRKARKSLADPRQALVSLIKTNRLSGSPRNQVDIVFDGYPREGGAAESSGLNIIYSRDISADERIRKMLEAAVNPKSIVVVSDDKEVRSFASIFGAQHVSVEVFLVSKEESAICKRQNAEPEIGYTAKHKINEELRKIWL